MDQNTTKQIKVMAVEDDPFISRVLIDDLTKAGYSVSSTQNGSEALSLAEKSLPDIITLDLVLPGTSGKEILAALKKHDKLKLIPVIIFSNLSSPVDEKETMDLGAAKYLIKVETEFPELDKIIRTLVPKPL